MATVWDVLKEASKYDGSPTAHRNVVDNLKRHGHKVSMSDQWCTETVMAILYNANAIGAVGGYQRTSGGLKKQAEKNGTWAKGTDDILPGDIVVFGSGKPNHTELCVGDGVTVAGNHKEISPDTCDRRNWKGRNVLGRVRPKYSKMPAMDDLQLTIAACDVLMGVYGKGDVRKRMLGVYGKENAKSIQSTVDDILKSHDKTIFAMAVYIICGRAGNRAYRKRRLGIFFDEAQGRVNHIISLRTHSIEEASTDVIQGKYGTNAVRRALLEFNGYIPSKVQALVNEHVKKRT